MSNKNTIIGTPEVLSAIVSADIGSDVNEIKTDTAGYIKRKYGVDLPAIDVRPVENTANEVHLPLPFYAGLEEATAQALSDLEAGKAGGGEFATIAVATLIIGGFIAGAGAIGSTGFFAADAAGHKPQQK